MLSQVMSMIGAVLLLGAFGGQQMKKLSEDMVTYQLMNLFGGTLLCLAAIGVRQSGLILVEGAWAVISVFGLVRVLRARRR
jgi:hypothetical protein